MLKSNLCDKLRTNLCGSFLCCFLSSWVLFPCLYLDNNYSISFFILFPTFIGLYDKFNFMLKILINIVRSIKITIKSFRITIILFCIIIMTWLNCYNCVDAKDTVFFWFRFLFFLNYFQLLFLLITLEA